MALKVDEATSQALLSIIMQWFPWSRETNWEVEVECSVCAKRHRETKTFKEEEGVRSGRHRTEECVGSAGAIP